MALLRPDVRPLTGDANGKAPTAIDVIHGADKVTRFLFGLAPTLRPGDVLTWYRLGIGQWPTGRLHGRLPGQLADIGR